MDMHRLYTHILRIFWTIRTPILPTQFFLSLVLGRHVCVSVRVNKFLYNSAEWSPLEPAPAAMPIHIVFFRRVVWWFSISQNASGTSRRKKCIHTHTNRSKLQAGKNPNAVRTTTKLFHINETKRWTRDQQMRSIHESPDWWLLFFGSHFGTLFKWIFFDVFFSFSRSLSIFLHWYYII